MIKQKELNMIQRGFVPILENSSCDPRILETLSIIHNYDSELLIHIIMVLRMNGRIGFLKKVRKLVRT